MVVHKKSQGVYPLLSTIEARALALADLKHLGSAYRADTLGGRPTVLHSDSFAILHLPLGTAFHTSLKPKVKINISPRPGKSVS